MPQRYEVMTTQPDIVDGHIRVPNTPGLGIDIVEDAIAKYPSTGNVHSPSLSEMTYVRARQKRASWLDPRTKLGRSVSRK